MVHLATSSALQLWHPLQGLQIFPDVKAKPLLQEVHFAAASHIKHKGSHWTVGLAETILS